MHARAAEPSLVHPLFHGVRLDGADIEDGLKLSVETDWNQSIEDWRFLLSNGLGLGFENASKQLVASTITLPLGKFAWIGMVLVSAQARRQRLATMLVQQALAQCEERGLVPLLDATAAGESVYSGIGFRGIGKIRRWRRSGDMPVSTSQMIGSRISPLTQHDFEAVARWDSVRFGVDRGVVLQYLAANSPSLALQSFDANGNLLGCCFGRSGRTATQIGPLVAETELAACELLNAELQRVHGPVLLDVIAGRSSIERILQENGLTPERDFLRMVFGSVAPEGRPECVYAIAGPELG